MTRALLISAVLGIAAACGSSFVGSEGSGGGAGQPGSGGANTASGGNGAASTSGGSGPGGGGSGGNTTGGRSDGGTGGDTGGSGMVGTGGANPGMGGDGTIGSGGTPGEPTCEELMQNYVKEVDKLRDCNVGAEQPECNSQWTFDMPCACPVGVNGYKDFTAAEAAYQAIFDAGCEFPVCEMACTALMGLCQPLTGTTRFVCQ